MQCFFRHYLDLSAEQPLKLVDESGSVEERWMANAVNQEVNVTGRSRLRATNRPEYPEMSEPVTLGRRKNRLPFRAQHLPNT